MSLRWLAEKVMSSDEVTLGTATYSKASKEQRRYKTTTTPMQGQPTLTWLDAAVHYTYNIRYSALNSSFGGGMKFPVCEAAKFNKGNDRQLRTTSSVAILPGFNRSQPILQTSRADQPLTG
jgi:hypothetical protein